MAKYIKTRKGSDGFYYPYTSPDLVVDEDGKSTTTKFSEINTQLENIGQSTQEQINTAIDKAIEEGKMYSDASKLSIIDENNNFMSDNVEGALEELNTQCKDIANKIENVVTYTPEDGDGDFITAENIAFSNENFTATNVKGAITELFQSASNGKSLIATAITGKGVDTNATDTFEHMAINIGQISTGSTGSTGVETGSFTPSENILTQTLTTSRRCSNVVLYKSNITLNSNGLRQMALYVQLEVGLKFGIGTNASGTTWGGILLLDISNNNPPLANFNDKSIDIRFTNSSGTGYMASGETYAWVAW